MRADYYALGGRHRRGARVDDAAGTGQRRATHQVKVDLARRLTTLVDGVHDERLTATTICRTATAITSFNLPLYEESSLKVS